MSEFLMICSKSNKCTYKHEDNTHCIPHVKRIGCNASCREEGVCIPYVPEKEGVISCSKSNEPAATPTGEKQVKEIVEKFWMIYVEGQRPPVWRHFTLELASDEAERLSRLPENQGKKVFVLEAVKCCRFDPTPTTWLPINVDLSFQDLISLQAAGKRSEDIGAGKQHQRHERGVRKPTPRRKRWFAKGVDQGLTSVKVVYVFTAKQD